MNGMKAVFRNELSTGFVNMTAYVFGTFLLFFVGLYTFIYDVQYSLANFEYVLTGMCFVFIIIVPVLTMRVLAEERHQKTDQLLYSLPLSMTQIVLGKYLAMLVMFVIPMIIVCIYPPILSLFGTVNFATVYGAIVGFIFLGAALLAIGLFISSVTESQAVAAAICFVVMLLNYFIENLTQMITASAAGSFAGITAIVVLAALIIWYMTKSRSAALITGAVAEGFMVGYYIFNSSAFDGLFTNIMDQLSLFEHFSVFSKGIFDIAGIIYFVSVIGVFIFLSVQSMEKRRWS